MMRWLTFVLIAISAGIMAPPPGHAGQYAIVIGVSGYDPKIIRPLKAPANDVRLVWDLLRDKGFAADNITVLADKIAPGKSAPAKIVMPTRQNIIGAFETLTSVLRARKNEEHSVFVYFSGHGSQQPQFELTDDVEPDNFDEVFLPVDTGKIDPFTRKIRNGLVDDEIKALLAKLKSTGNTFVWVVFDACHSGDMVRGAAKDVQSKFVPSDSLVPTHMREEWYKSLAKLKQKRAGAATRTLRKGSANTGLTRGQATTRSSSWLSAAPGKTSAMTVFSAVSEDKLALEMPVREAGNTVYSIFTYHLIKAIREAPLPSYRDLAAQILRLHAGFAMALPSPVYEGDLDRPLTMAAGAHTVWQWPAKLSQDRSYLNIAVGTIGGVSKGAILKISNGVEKSALGYARVFAADAGQSRARSASYAGLEAKELSRLKGSLTASVVSRAIAMSLRVAVAGATAIPQANAILAALRKQKGGPDALPIEWVATGGNADVYLYVDAGQIYIVPGTSTIKREKGHKSFGVAHGADTDRAVKQLRNDLWKIMRRKNLLKIAATMSQSPIDKTVGVRLFHIKGRKPHAAKADRFTCPAPDMDNISSGGTLLSAVQTSEVRHCDILRLEVSNSGKKRIQVAALLLGPDASITVFNVGNRPVIKPGQALSATNFIQVTTWCTGATCKKLGLRPGEQPVGLEHLLLLTFELDEGVSPRSLAYLAQPSLSRVAKARGAVTRGRLASQLEGLLRQVALVPATRGLSTSPAARSFMRLLQWQIVR